MKADTGPFDVGPLLRPRSIAIVGVSPEPGSLGGAVLANLERFSYQGDIHLVSRRGGEIAGRPCLPSIDDLPDGIDVAVLAVPAAGVRDAVAACIRRKVRAALVYAAGFGEIGEAGRVEQDAIAAIARDAGLALNGPNCIGLVNFSDSVPLTYEPVTPQPQGDAPAVGVVAQSGAMLSSLRAALLGKGLALSSIVSTGNEAGLSSEDFLDFLVDDARTRAIVMFAEQIRHPSRFLAVAARARRQAKPIVLMHPGRSRRAQESARTHTGALAGDHAVMTALAGHEAVVLVDTTEELIDTAEMLARFAPPKAGAAIVTNSGAFKGFALDFCDAIGLDLPQPAAQTRDALRATLPPFAAIDNPLDTTGQTIKDPSIFTHAATHLLGDAGMGSLVVSIVPGGPKQAMAKVEALLPPLTATDKPVAVAVMGDEGPLPENFVPSFRDKGVPVFRSPERALRAMAHATRYGTQLSTADGTSDVVVPNVTLARTGTWPEYAGKALLAELDIPVPRGALVRNLDEAHGKAREIGYPVVLKAQAADLPHKSDAGGVVIDITGEAVLQAAWHRLHDNVAEACPGLALDGILIERMAEPGGVEMVVGGRRDPDWGPLMLVGLGGIWVEALHDVRVMPPALDRAAIMAELKKLKGAALLRGLRGAPPADMNALADVITKIGALLRAHPQIAEIDINPLLVYPDRVLALDALVVVSTSSSP